MAVKEGEEREEKETAVKDLHLWIFDMLSKSTATPPIPKVITFALEMSENNENNANGGGNRGCPSGNKNCSRTESLHFLSVLEEHLPIGPCI